MPFAYARMQGAGNRILIVDERKANRPPLPQARIRELAADDSLAFDQLMWLGRPASRSQVASYRVFNADGSEVQQCGNGVRCVAWLLAREGRRGDTMELAAPTGTVRARFEDDGRIAVDMGAPVFEPAAIPFVADRQAMSYELDVDGEVLTVHVLSMGNPHCVMLVADVARADVRRLGPLIESHPRFPERVNAGFMALCGRDSIDLRVHERGVGETLACGTGACAAVVAGRRLGRLDETVAVHLPGGQLMVSWRGDGEAVWLTGDVRLESEGIIDL